MNIKKMSKRPEVVILSKSDVFSKYFLQTPSSDISYVDIKPSRIKLTGLYLLKIWMEFMIPYKEGKKYFEGKVVVDALIDSGAGCCVVFKDFLDENCSGFKKEFKKLEITDNKIEIRFHWKDSLERTVKEKTTFVILDEESKADVLLGNQGFLFERNWGGVKGVNMTILLT